MKVCGRDIVAEGRLIRIARLDGDNYKFLDDPERFPDELRRSETRINLFTFLQKLPDTSLKYHYPMEWDNLAVPPTTTFEHWWTQQIGFKARNKASKLRRRELRSGKCHLTMC